MNNELIKDANGFIKTAQGTSVNPNFISDQGLASARAYSGAGPVSTTIDAAAVGGSQPLNIPQTPTPTTAVGITGASDATLAASQKALTDAATAAKDTAKTGLDESKSSLTSLMSQITGIQGSRGQVEKDLGIEEKTKSYNDATSALDATKRAHTNELRAIDTNTGMNDVQKNAARSEINRKYAFQEADQSLILDVANRNLSSAQATADRRIELQLEPLKTQLDFTKMFYEDNKDTFNKAEERDFNLKIQNDERAYDEQKTKLKTLSDAKLSLMTGATEVGAPAGVLAAIQNAKTPEEAIAAAGKYGAGIDLKIKEATLSKTYADIAKSRAEAQQALTTLPGPVATRVQSVAGQFDGEQAVKNYQTIAETVDAVKNAGVTPTDDIQRIYGVAKVFDPNSAVREGEYATVQEYATSLLQRAGLKANRVFNNDGFLTPEARTFINTTLDNRLASSEKAYQNIYNSYAERVNKVTGKTDGKDYITDYSAAFKKTDTNNTQNNTQKPGVGAIIESGGKRYKVGADGETLEPIK
jgi:hypothetical protein